MRTLSWKMLRKTKPKPFQKNVKLFFPKKNLIQFVSGSIQVNELFTVCVIFFENISNSLYLLPMENAKSKC